MEERIPPSHLLSLSCCDGLMTNISSFEFERDDDHDIATAPPISDDTVHCNLHLSALATVIVWNDNGDDIRHTSKLLLDLHVDTSDNQALFVAYRPVFLHPLPRPLNLYLFVYPESIHSLEFETDANPPASDVIENHVPDQRFGCLRFNMTQSPDLVAPHHPPLEQFEHESDTVKALSLVLNFSIYLDLSSIQPEILRQISSLPSLFSPTNLDGRLLKTDGRRANLKSLYRGQGGRRIDSTAIPAHGTAQGATVEVPIKAASDGLQSPARFSTPSGTSPKPYLVPI